VTGHQATEIMNIFEPTEEIDKFCAVDEHSIAYDKWINSVMTKELRLTLVSSAQLPFQK
jgi:hypothetical protein